MDIHFIIHQQVVYVHTCVYTHINNEIHTCICICVQICVGVCVIQSKSNVASQRKPSMMKDPKT